MFQLVLVIETNSVQIMFKLDCEHAINR